MSNYSRSIDNPGDDEDSMDMTDAEKVRVILESDLLASFPPQYIKDLLDCKEMLIDQGYDSLMYEDPETVIRLVKWKRET